MTHRIARVSELIRRELATVFSRDFEFAGKLVTVHEAVIAPDLKNGTVYVGILGGTDADHAQIMETLNRKHGLIQRELYKRVKLKSSPQLYFKLDNSAERGVRLINLIEQLPEASDQPAPEGPARFIGKDGLDHRWEKS